MYHGAWCGVGTGLAIGDTPGLGARRARISDGRPSPVCSASTDTRLGGVLAACPAVGVVRAPWSDLRRPAGAVSRRTAWHLRHTHRGCLPGAGAW